MYSVWLKWARESLNRSPPKIKLVILELVGRRKESWIISAKVMLYSPNSLSTPAAKVLGITLFRIGTENGELQEFPTCKLCRELEVL